MKYFVHGYRLISALLLLSTLAFPSISLANEKVHPFVSGSLAQILDKRADKPFILIFWSLTCGYCPSVMQSVSKEQARFPDLEVVLVATDTLEESTDTVEKATLYGMHAAEQWVFADDMPERLRFEIDPRWYGELPRTYFYDQKHQAIVKSGMIDTKFIQNWIAQNIAISSRKH